MAMKNQSALDDLERRRNAEKNVQHYYNPDMNKDKDIQEMASNSLRPNKQKSKVLGPSKIITALRQEILIAQTLSKQLHHSR